MTIEPSSHEAVAINPRRASGFQRRAHLLVELDPSGTGTLICGRLTVVAAARWFTNLAFGLLVIMSAGMLTGAAVHITEPPEALGFVTGALMVAMPSLVVFGTANIGFKATLTNKQELQRCLTQGLQS